MVYKQLEERNAPRASVTLTTLGKMKASGEKIASMTAYDASFAQLIDQSGVGGRIGVAEVIDRFDNAPPHQMTPDSVRNAFRKERVLG